MFNKQQREKLNDLSAKLYGSSSRWQKLIEDPRFRRVTEVVDMPDAPTYIQFQRKAGDAKGRGADTRPGTVMRAETAIARGLVDKDYKPQVSKQAVSRDLTYDEIVETLQASLDATLIGSMTPQGQSLVFAQKFLEKKLPYSLVLLKTADNKAATDELLKLVPQESRELVEKIIVDTTSEEEPKVHGMPLEADKFLTDLTFVNAHKDAAAEEIAMYFASAQETHNNNLKLDRMRGAFNAQFRQPARSAKKPAPKKLAKADSGATAGNDSAPKENTESAGEPAAAASST